MIRYHGKYVVASGASSGSDDSESQPAEIDIMPNPEMTSLFAMIERTLDQVLEPIEDELWNEHDPGEDLPDENRVRVSISFDVLEISHQIAEADGCVAKSEMRMLRDIAICIAPSYKNWSEEEIIELIEESHIDRDDTRFGSYPKILLQTYDRENGTRLCDLYVGMLFRIANSIAKADGRVSPAEERVLMRLKEDLFDETIGVDDDTHSDAGHTTRTPPQKSQPESIDSLIQELEKLIGLDTVKSDVSQLVNFLRVQQVRASKGMPSIPVSRHLVLSGNPGTGKTTVARLIARIYHALGILSRGHLIESDRAGMVAGFVGQTAIKVKEIVKSAIGGVLFIDEAYTLAGSGQDYGQEAIDTLLKYMEDNRDDLIVVVAGYPDKMAGFIESNPGLRSRFNKNLHFVDYSPGELLKIFDLFCTSSGFRLSPNARTKVSQLFAGLYEVRDATFGNARVARNLFEQVISHQANRIVSLPKITDAILETIESIDIPGSEDRPVDRDPIFTTAPQFQPAVPAISVEPAKESIRFPCPSCGKSIKAPSKMAGKEAACPGCTTRIVVPPNKGADGVSMLW